MPKDPLDPKDPNNKYKPQPFHPKWMERVNRLIENGRTRDVRMKNEASDRWQQRNDEEDANRRWNHEKLARDARTGKIIDVPEEVQLGEQSTFPPRPFTKDEAARKTTIIPEGKGKPDYAHMPGTLMSDAPDTPTPRWAQGAAPKMGMSVKPLFTPMRANAEPLFEKVKKRIAKKKSGKTPMSDKTIAEEYRLARGE